MANRRKSAVPDVGKESKSPFSEPPQDTQKTAVDADVITDGVLPVDDHQSSPVVELSDETAAAEGPTSGPSAPSDINELSRAIRPMICVPRARGAVPALVYYREGFLKRYCIIDLDGERLAKAWSYYRANSAAPNPAEFVHLVIGILDTDFPRMYRAVSLVPLE